MESFKCILLHPTIAIFMAKFLKTICDFTAIGQLLSGIIQNLNQISNTRRLAVFLDQNVQNRMYKIKLFSFKIETTT